MKYLLIILLGIFIDNGCSQSKINQDSISLEYTTQSRGSYQQIIINKKRVSVENKRDSDPINKPCTEDDWSKLMKALKTVDVENIPNLKAPSEKRFFDGAAIANLKIIYNGNTYKTPSFDHGNPHEDITNLVKEILSLSENIE